MAFLRLGGAVRAARVCGARFFLPAEYDGPGTVDIFEFRCVLRRQHRGGHHVEEVR